MQARSPTVALAETGAADLSDGTDSPVSAASSVRRFLTSTSRMSAGILSPDSRDTISPGTSFSAGIMEVCPLRKVLASAESMLRIEFEGLLSPAFLDEAKQSVDDDDAEDDRRVEP